MPGGRYKLSVKKMLLQTGLFARAGNDQNHLQNSCQNRIVKMDNQNICQNRIVKMNSQNSCQNDHPAKDPSRRMIRVGRLQKNISNQTVLFDLNLDGQDDEQDYF